MRRWPKWIRPEFAIVLIVLGYPILGWGGSFIFSLTGGDTLNNQDFIMHPTGYTGAGAALTVKLCIVPGSPNAAAMVTPVANIAAKMTALAGTTGNLSTSAGGDMVPVGSMDFESVALHEIGHCLGLAHPNAATESGLVGADQNYTKASEGADVTFDLGAGGDTIIGSADDARDDDVSVHWFRTSTNNPCAAPASAVFDSSTYTVAGALPGGDDYAANADRSVCTALGVLSTEAVMQQGSFFDEGQRFLGHDDEAMLRLAMSGLDETTGGGDDYTLTVTSGGVLADASCDINIEFDDGETGFALCSVMFDISISGNLDHGVITSADAFFNDAAVMWFFNTTPVQLQSFSVD